MEFTFDYRLPEVAASSETLRVAERGVLDLVEDDDLSTVDFCITDTSRLKGRVIPVEGLYYKIARVEYAVDGKTSDGMKVSEGSVGRLWLEDVSKETTWDWHSSTLRLALLCVALIVLTVCILYIHW